MTPLGDFLPNSEKMTPQMKTAFFTWLDALRRGDTRAQRLVEQYDAGEVTVVEAWGAIVEMYGQ